MMDAATATGARSPRSAAAAEQAGERVPGTYSITTKSSPPVATTSSVDTTLGCLMPAASRASSRNIATNSGLRSARWGSSRLMATVREKPAAPTSRPRWTTAIPPDAISWRSA